MDVSMSGLLDVHVSARVLSQDVGEMGAYWCGVRPAYVRRNVWRAIDTVAVGIGVVFRGARWISEVVLVIFEAVRSASEAVPVMGSLHFFVVGVCTFERHGVEFAEEVNLVGGDADQQDLPAAADEAQMLPLPDAEFVDDLDHGVRFSFAARTLVHAVGEDAASDQEDERDHIAEGEETRTFVRSEKRIGSGDGPGIIRIHRRRRSRRRGEQLEGDPQ